MSFFSFFPIHITKEKGKVLVELMKELTNITKILQFVVSAQPLSLQNRGGDPGCTGRGGRGRGRGEGQLGLWNSLIFFLSPPKVNDILLFKHCFLGFIDP